MHARVETTGFVQPKHQHVCAVVLQFTHDGRVLPLFRQGEGSPSSTHMHVSVLVHGFFNNSLVLNLESELSLLKSSAALFLSLGKGSCVAGLHRRFRLVSGIGYLGRIPQVVWVSVCSDDASGANTRPPLLVTASVDRIALARRLSIAEDLSMTGQVVWTGRSSMDIRMQLTQAFPNPKPCVETLDCKVAKISR